MSRPPPLRRGSAVLSACDNAPLPCLHRMLTTMTGRGSSTRLGSCGYFDAHFQGSQWPSELLKSGIKCFLCRVCSHVCGVPCGVNRLWHKGVQGVQRHPRPRRRARRVRARRRAHAYRSLHTLHTLHNAGGTRVSLPAYPAHLTAHPAQARARAFSIPFNLKETEDEERTSHGASTWHSLAGISGYTWKRPVHLRRTNTVVLRPAHQGRCRLLSRAAVLGYHIANHFPRLPAPVLRKTASDQARRIDSGMVAPL